MLRKLIAYFLILSIVTSGFSRFFVYAGFMINKKYIASTLCENKNKPELHCEGKCYLIKKVKLAEEKEKRAERSGQKGKYQEAFLDRAFRLEIPVAAVRRSLTYFSPKAICKRSYPIFHPPARV